MNSTQPTVVLNDALFRWLLIPLFGIAIPLLTNMIPHDRLNLWQIKLSYLYTIGIAFIIYQGNRYLHFTLRTYFTWYRQPLKKIAAFLFVILFFTLPVSILLLVGWYQLFNQPEVEWFVIKNASLIILACVIVLVHVYETAFLVMESQQEMVLNAQLQQARAEAELDALKNQIDPHFIFNSLNTLSHLIEQDSARARLFNDRLADVYRYILKNKARELVLLSDEMQFLDDYFSLLLIRFESAIELQNRIPDSWLLTRLIPPISLQILVENAIKHNQFSNQEPLVIEMEAVDNCLVVANTFRPKETGRPSSKIGLQNLEQRFRLITGLPVNIVNSDDKYRVSLPLITV